MPTGLWGSIGITGGLLSAGLTVAACTAAPAGPLTPSSAVVPSDVLCRDLAQPGKTTLNASGGSLSVTIQAPSECRWSAEAPATTAWITVQNAGPHVGPAHVTFIAEPNRAFGSRVSAVLLRDGDGRLRPAHTVPQRAATCLYEVSRPTLTLDSFGTWDGSGDSAEGVMVTARPASCQWTATASDPWILISNYSAQGTGDRQIFVSVAPNWNNPTRREGTVTIAGLSGVNPNAVVAVAQTGR